jgi:hypothetical protein
MPNGPKEVVNFYDVGGLLVRRWVPAQRRKGMEVWNRDGWAPYPDVDNVLRYGQRLTEVRALALLHEARDHMTPARFSDEEAYVALRSRLRRA